MIYSLFVRNVVHATLVPGVTTTDTTHGHPASTKYPVTLHGGLGIFRTARIEAAIITEKGTDEIAIDAN